MPWPPSPPGSTRGPAHPTAQREARGTEPAARGERRRQRDGGDTDDAGTFVGELESLQLRLDHPSGRVERLSKGVRHHCTSTHSRPEFIVGKGGLRACSKHNVGGRFLLLHFSKVQPRFNQK